MFYCVFLYISLDYQLTNTVSSHQFFVMAVWWELGRAQEQNQEQIKTWNLKIKAVTVNLGCLKPGANSDVLALTIISATGISCQLRLKFMMCISSYLALKYFVWLIQMDYLLTISIRIYKVLLNSAVNCGVGSTHQNN